jgi:tetratricopeptide (TPR) repeat protein
MALGNRPGIGLVLVFSLVLLANGTRPGAIQAQAPDRSGGPEPASAEDDRERQTAERFLALLEKSPRRGTALDRVYGYHVERGTLNDLIKRYQERTAKDPKDGTAWLLLGLFEAQRGRDSAAVSAFRQAEATRLDDPLASFYLGQALVLVGQPDAAADAFERAIARKPSRTDLLPIFQALGRVHQRAYHTEKALGVWNRLEALFPDDLRVQEQIAEALAEETDPARALPRYENLAQKATDDYRKVEFRMEAAELKVRLGRRAEALADFEALLGRLNPESWLYREVRHKIEEVFLRNDDQAGLAVYYENWLKKNPEDVEAMARLGRTLAMQGRAGDARTWFDKAVKLAPTRKELRLALIEQLVQEKKFAEAAAQYEAMTKADPNNPDLIREWGRLLLGDTTRPEAERKQAAAAVWRRLVEARPKDAATAVLVADLFRQAEMPDQALDLYKKAIELAPDSAQYHEYLGEYYHTLKRPKEALETWGKIAAGPNRTAKNLGRLAEVLAGFGYLKEALAPLDEACRLDPETFDYPFKYADLLLQAGRYDDALKQLDRAAKAADDAEQLEAVLDFQIKTYQAAEKLTEQIDALRKDLDAGKDATADRWRRLARYDEADQKLPEALAAVGKAVALDEKSVAVWTAFARIHEASGDLGGAVDAYRRLAKLDRRALTEYLTKVTALEVRLGRRDRALEAGREVLAAAPGNPESYQFFSELCAQLGEVEEGLNTLRRAVRVNPNDNKALLTLGEALAREFRTEEAIELYWRAFEKAPDLEARLTIVARLTDLYLQRNQFDRLVARLEREQREAKQPREMAICLAQAYQSSGDFGTARAELERLLAANPRDTALLQQLSSLAETDGDLAFATKYQKQLNEIAPSDEGAARLAQLYLRAGEASEAEAIWARTAGGKQEPHRILQTVDQLLANDKPQTALGITERLLRDKPDQWEALYREGVALTMLEKPDEAERRFRALLDLPTSDDETSAAHKAMEKAQAGRPAGAKTRNIQRVGMPAITPTTPLENRTQALWQILQATGLSGREYYNYGQQNRAWGPDDFGQARMAALGWLLNLAQKKNKLDERVAEFRQARDKTPNDLRKLWDAYYLSLVRQEPAETHEAALALSRAVGADPTALWAYLHSLPTRANVAGQQVYQDEEGEVVDKTPPLPNDELEHVLACYKALRARRPDWADAAIIGGVSNELKRARRTEESDRFYQDAIASLGEGEQAGVALALAAERGDVATFLKFLDRQVQKAGNTPGAFGIGMGMGVGMGGQFYSLEQLMVARSEKKAPEDVLKLFDYFFDWYTHPDRIAARLRSQRGTSFGNQNQIGLQLRFGKRYQYFNIDYPSANRYFDQSAIQILRTAFEIYKRDDLVSDLFTHVRKRVEAAPEPARVYPLLALGYLHWWNDDKEEAIRTLSRASSEAKDDPDLQLELAEIRLKRNEPDEALALVESVEPLDQRTMQRREIMALHLAVLTGNVPRARKAAERLFNLRLDTDLQVQLAAQMHQLGMHDLAEAVLARARRRAGSNTSTLVGLMQQYQRQNKMDVAVQVAHQILRHAPAKSFRPYQDQDDVARREAIQVLARSGKLNDMIGRVESQLKTSPNSVQLLQILAEYHKAAGEPEKARAALERVAQARPDDASQRYQIGMQLMQAGDHAGALPHFKAAIKKDPSLFAYRYWEIQNAFQQSDKLDELAAIFEDADIKKLGNFWSVEQLISQLMQNDKTRERGLSLFRKMWKAFPQQRGNMITNGMNGNVWNLPEMYDFAREAIIPTAATKQVSRWAGLDQIYSWSGGGHVNGVAEQLLNAAAKQNKLEALDKEVAEALKRVPEWTGGKVFSALILVKRGRLDEAERIVKDLMANDTKDKDPIPYATRLFLGQALENYGQFQATVLNLYERAHKNDTENVQGLDYEFNPVRRLVAMYRKVGRTTEARDLVLKYARQKNPNDQYNPGYAEYRRIESLGSIGRELIELGFPVDAVPLFDEALSDPEMIRRASRWMGGDDSYMLRQLREGLSQSLRGLNEKTLPQTVRTLLNPSSGAHNGTLDLVLLIHPREADRAALRSLLDEALRSAAKRPERRSEVKTRLDELVAKHPQDFSVQVAAALFAATESTPDRLADASARLTRLADGAPLEELSEGTRANARQRDEAAKRLGLWLVARECWKHDSTRENGDRLAAQALDGARRQADPLWTLAMLREWGQIALDRGDRATAERRWTQMLDLALAGPATGVKEKGPEKGASAATTLDRFELAAQLAKLAAGHGMVGLSLRAVRQPLASGPPVIPIPIETNNRGMVIQRNRNEGDDQDQTARRVEALLTELDVRWERQKHPADSVYETLRDIVLPEGRPTEIFLYPRPLAGSVRHPRSVSEMLARWAARAGKLDDLRQRIETRKGQASADLASEVLLTQRALAGRDWPEAARTLTGLESRLRKDTLQNSAMLACLAALPALDFPETAAPARAVLELAVKNLASRSESEPLADLHCVLAHADFKANRVAEGRKQMQNYQNVLMRNIGNYGGDYGLYVRKQNLQKVAAEYARAGQWSDALDLLGQFVDAPAYRGGDPSLGNIVTMLARQFATLPARERYDRLKAWTMPAANRRSVRLLASFVPEDVPPAVFGTFPTSAFDAGIASTAGMLIASAQEAETLDELAREATQLADQKVENAETLLILTQVAREMGELARPRLRARLDKIKAEASKNPPVLWADVLLARACANHPALRRDPGVELIRALISQSQKTQNWAVLSHLRRDLAVSEVARAGDQNPVPGAEPGLAFWHPADVVDANRHSAGGTPGWWVEAEGYFKQVTGPQDEFLLFDYPLTGRFELAMDAFFGGWAESQAGYGGLVFEVSGTTSPTLGVMPVGRSERVTVPNRYIVPDAFNRVSIQVEPEKVRFLINGHLIYEDEEPSPTSPWLALFTSWARQSSWRNLTLTGAPTIPRQVPLTSGDRLEGWVSSFLNQKQPPRRSLSPDDPQREALASDAVINDYDWVARDGVLRCRRTEPSSGHSAVQSRLYYHRPLRPGETIDYEFYYEPGAVMIHPTLDRLTFLLEPEGVRLHWITDGLDNEWTGLTTGNVADEPTNRRGPGALPLRPKAWNAVQVRLEGDTAVLALNGVEVYRRPLEPDNSRQFGFFHFRDRTEAQARNVVLKGDWPESVPAEALANLAARRPGVSDSPEERRARHNVMGEDKLVQAAGSVLGKARALPLQERYAYLVDWVLPRVDNDNFRLQGDFTPTDAAPAVASPEPNPPDNPAPTRVHTGGQLVAPALELVATARQIGKLDALAEQVRKIKPGIERNQRGQLALLALIALAQGRTDEAKDALRRLHDLSKALPLETAIWLRWPELVAHAATVGRPEVRAESDLLGTEMIMQWHNMGSKNLNARDRGPWGRHAAYAARRAAYLGLPEKERDEIAVEVRLPHWSRVEHATAASRGQGMPIPRWVLREGVLRHNEGQNADYLYLNIPIQGDFEVTCELKGLAGTNQMNLTYGGIRVFVAWDRKSARVFSTDREIRQVSFDPPLEDLKGWYPCRLVVKDRTYGLFFNGRKVVEEPLPPGNDPWLAIHNGAEGQADLRNLKIEGRPTIPAALEISSLPDLTGWLADYYQERLDGDASSWTKKGEEIVGRNIGSNSRPTTDRWGNEETDFFRNSARLGSKQESLLQYHRPMVEDGEIRYEFFYEPGKTVVHPALDRLTFVLDPAGVKVHWLTDAQHDRTGLGPENLLLEPQNQRGSGRLPLKPNEWNRVALRLTGDLVSLSLNGESIFERRLEPTNGRQFGLFHYADESEARVRHVHYEGRWLREMPRDLFDGTRGAEAANRASLK